MLKGGCTGWSETTLVNATLLEIACRCSNRLMKAVQKVPSDAISIYSNIDTNLYVLGKFPCSSVVEYFRN